MCVYSIVFILESNAAALLAIVSYNVFSLAASFFSASFTAASFCATASAAANASSCASSSASCASFVS